ncbi:hypothetical protein [Ulvibacter litoralis]|uniref:Uncharacterized protein n=1 Tax=Ulvibacter litoralis TaxID=227084 RepID=A0A1G7HLA1_9FLAO|nr:hypothetical protein [Ulvibacter litoralis]GHC58245.1 hypothetical protein GCM10008083_23680 [Ulvibacter litoralis]SDF01141.1 hypothetical protein SAMN05421855_104157 [Ulvibacter litoralis]
MRKKTFHKELIVSIPLLCSGLLCIGLIYLLWEKSDQILSYNEQLSNLTTVLIGISGFLATIIMIYLAAVAVIQKKPKITENSDFRKATQKMHDFRSIIELLVQSKMWLPEVREYIDEEFEDLSFFEVKEFYKGKSKLAIEFLQENKSLADTKNLYLEMKSLLMTSPKDKKIVANISFPKYYSKDIVEKWLEHKSGAGLWYYFGYKFGTYKDALNIEAVYERHQNKIMTLANTIDSTIFEDSSFNEVFLSKLGEYMSKDVIPMLHNDQETRKGSMSELMQYFYCIFIMLTVFGVLFPLLYLLLNLPILVLIVSISLVVSCLFFLTTTFYYFLTSELKK